MFLYGSVILHSETCYIVRCAVRRAYILQRSPLGTFCIQTKTLEIVVETVRIMLRHVTGDCNLE